MKGAFSGKGTKESSLRPVEMPYNDEDSKRVMASAIRSMKPSTGWDRSASADLFRHTLVHISSLFGRLLYLNSLRDLNSGAYKHWGLNAAFGREQSAQALEANHVRAFREWTKLSLAEKHADLEAYLATVVDPKGLVIRYWLDSTGYAGCVPDAASKADRALFLEDIRVLLTALSRSTDGASTDPKSSRRK
jgi:hypothetical protein